MKNKIFTTRLPHIITIAVNLLLLVAVVYLMNYVQTLLYSDVKINLTEVVTQNKDVITSKLKLELNNLDLVANQIVDRLRLEPDSSDETLKKVFVEYSATVDDTSLFFATRDGEGCFYDGSVLDISGRKYFRLALEGNANISDRIVSRQDGNEIFAISVPLRYQDEIVGTIQKSYTPQEMYRLCSLSLFSSQGFMYVINQDGYILINSSNQEYSQETENYYRMLYAQGNQEASMRLEGDIRNGRSGFLETVINDQKMFSAYTPIEEVHDWFLISSVAVSAVSPNSNIVVRMFYFILCVIVLIVGMSALYFFSYKNKQQTNLEHIAFYDSVTHGNTFTKFAVDFHETLSAYPNKPYFLLKFDIDNFKYVNNFYGFDFGDKVLLEINASIQSKLLPGETIARVSSDHFIVLLEEASEARLNELLDCVRDDEGVPLYFSAGLYPINDRTESLNLMVDKASTAAQSAKGSLQKKLVFYSEKFDQQIMRNEQLKRSIQQALADHEIIPFYQPKVNVLSGELAGAEALARWRTKEGKLIPPFEFIPLCEKTGMIVELDMAVFEGVLQFLHGCLVDGVACVPVSVNFSRLHLTNKDFLDNIVAKLNEYDVPPNLIELELTESVMFDNHEMIADFIERLHEKNLLISMDDFGSGYSSLNMLKDVPIDVLKIDKGFLQDTQDYERRNIIFATIADMARRLHIKVVVEGVETFENVELMKEFGCNIAQGYYYAKPMDEADFNRIYRAGRISNAE